MENDRLLWVLILAFFLVVGMNVMIYLTLRGKKSEDMINPVRNLSKGIRNPWEVEDFALNELSDLVASIKVENSANQENLSGREQED